MLGPSQLGPLRYPVRNLPCFLLGVFALIGLLLSQSRAPRYRGRLYAAFAVTAASAFVAYSQKPATSHSVAFTAVVTAAVIWFVWRTGPAVSSSAPEDQLDSARKPRTSSTLRVPAALLMLAVTLGFVVLQHRDYARSDLENWGVPDSAASYKNITPTAVNDGIVVGGVGSLPDRSRIYREAGIANSWYLNAHSFQNVYSVLGFKGYSGSLCMDYLGSTCPGLLTRLFQTRPDTGLQLVDELGIDTILIIKRQVDPALWSNPEPGWSISSNRDLTITWTRNHPLGPAGKIVQTSPGVNVTPIGVSDREVTFRVNSVGAGGGDVVFSRLNWPGYGATNATVMAPIDKFLLRVHVSADATGKDRLGEVHAAGLDRIAHGTRSRPLRRSSVDCQRRGRASQAAKERTAAVSRWTGLKPSAQAPNSAPRSAAGAARSVRRAVSASSSPSSPCHKASTRAASPARARRRAPHRRVVRAADRHRASTAPSARWCGEVVGAAADPGRSGRRHRPWAPLHSPG